jgi:hypothetical protein
MTGRTLHLNVDLLHAGVYPSAWRLPDYSLAQLDLDKPLPDPLPLPPDANHTMFLGTVVLARRDGLTVRQLLRALSGGVGHRIDRGLCPRRRCPIHCCHDLMPRLGLYRRCSGAR